ncbi:hypothetical protein AB0M58_21700 [Streptomyces bobili]|uniref:hypothetical protein n=1 Tax=Streptomyces bobili TaxID=67280 RepID=UPI00344984C7
MWESIVVSPDEPGGGVDHAWTPVGGAFGFLGADHGGLSAESSRGRESVAWPAQGSEVPYGAWASRTTLEQLELAERVHREQNEPYVVVDIQP